MLFPQNERVYKTNPPAKTKQKEDHFGQVPDRF
jgi:hypothetical protein